MESEKLIKEALSYSLAYDLHEIWRKSRKQEDGSYKSRYKKSKDEEWNISHGTDEVDIANLSFTELPSNCQNEELEEPRIIIELVYNKIMSNQKIDNQEINKISATIHEEWQKRNDWIFDPIYGEYELAVPFEKLNKKRQNQCRSGVIPGIAKVEDYKNGKINIEDICNQYGLIENTKTK